jgi:SpoVK/Ycf46/Vps4 family AAA+-type ATPase
MFEMKLNVVADGNTQFPPNSMSVWVTDHDWHKIFSHGESQNAPRYVKVTSKKNVLQKFTFYAKVDILNEKSSQTDGTIWVPEVLMHRTWVYDIGIIVEVEPINTMELQPIEALTIRLNPEEVANWSDDEIQTAESLFLSRIGITYQSQMAYIKPATKQTVVGEVTAIFPKPKERGVAFRVDSNTKLAFEGLPVNRQKIIDFSKIGGLNNVINRLREIIQIPINYPELLRRFGIDPPKGMILYGPPGNGKTMIARAVAQSMGSSFIEIDRSELLSKYVGDSEKHLERKFQEASIKGNCVIFIDEIDSLASVRNDKSAEHQVSLVATLLVLMDGINSNNRVFVIGATNRLETVDPALRRPGRFDLEFEVPLPDLSGRLDILHKYVPMKRQELLAPSVNEHTIALLSELTGGYSGADMKMLYREASMNAIRRNMKFDNDTGKVKLISEVDDIKLKDTDFFSAMKEITPTQMRGEQVMEDVVSWDEIVGLEDQKIALQNIDKNFSKCISSDMLQDRPSSANLLFVGRRGCGKRTLATAFAKKFGYEIFSTDCVEIESSSIEDALLEIHRIATKCRQAAPSIWLIQNLDHCYHKELFAYKINNELSRLNKHMKVLAILIADNDEDIPLASKGYKAFETRIDLDIDESHILEAIGQLFPDIKCSSDTIAGCTLGQIIHKMREEMIINK